MHVCICKFEGKIETCGTGEAKYSNLIYLYRVWIKVKNDNYRKEKKKFHKRCSINENPSCSTASSNPCDHVHFLHRVTTRNTSRMSIILSPFLPPPSPLTVHAASSFPRTSSRNVPSEFFSPSLPSWNTFHGRNRGCTYLRPRDSHIELARSLYLDPLSNVIAPRFLFYSFNLSW